MAGKRDRVGARKSRPDVRRAAKRGASSAARSGNRSMRGTARSLRERVKELTCLYGIAKLMARSDAATGRILRDIANLIPPAWQYPRIARCCIALDGREYCSAGTGTPKARQTAEIRVNGIKRGRVSVIYAARRPASGEGPFLKEERRLLDAIAKQVATIVQRREAEQEKDRLRMQLLHADRLATIGQLAAGVAHEINEPLGGILGFAQLALKDPAIAGQTRSDVEKIVAASLRAREIIRKLLLFARQSPPQKTLIDLNKVAAEGLSLFEHRCEKEGIALVQSLALDLPLILADGGQLLQVLVNLVVNAIQAMPKGGTLTIATRVSDWRALLAVQDTGVGMSRETQSRMFVPFFTTKDVNEGTGLGLPVVHGILFSHGAKISVESETGKGATFLISFPLPQRISK